MKATMMVYILMFCKSLEAYCITLELEKDGLKFELSIQKLKENHKITLEDIKSPELRKKLEDEMQKMKEYDFGDLINIMDKIIEYPIFRTLNVIDRSYKYINCRTTKKIGDEEYIEGFNILDYNKVIKNLNLSKDVYVTNSMIESYIKNLVYEKCNEIIPKDMLKFERVPKYNISNLWIMSEKKENGSDRSVRIDNCNNLTFTEIILNRTKLYYLPIKRNIVSIIPTENTIFGLMDYITLYFYSTINSNTENILKNELLVVIKKSTLRNDRIENIIKRLKRKIGRKESMEIVEEVYADKDIVMLIVK